MAQRLVSVVPFGGTDIKYGFKTDVEETVGTAAGHTAITGAYPTGLVIGANAPKPGRCSKRRTTGEIDSTYYTWGNYAALRAAGYSCSLPSIRRGSASTRSKPVYITIDGLKYAWRMPITTYAAVGGDLAALGILDASQADTDLVWGASYPKPPKVSKFTGTSTVSTFCDPDAADALPDGWSSSSREQYTGA